MTSGHHCPYGAERPFRTADVGDFWDDPAMSSAQRVAGLAAALTIGLAASVHGTDLGAWLVYGRILLWDDFRRLGPIAFVAGLALSAAAASIGRPVPSARRSWTLVAAGTALATVPLVAAQAARGTIRGLTLISASPSPTAFAAGLGVVFGYGLAVGSIISLAGEPQQGPWAYRVGIIAALVAGDAVRLALNTQWQTGLAIVATAASTAAAITSGTDARAGAAIAWPTPGESAAPHWLPHRLPLWPLLVAIAATVALLIGETVVSARFELAVNGLYGSGGDLSRARVGFVLFALVACVLVAGLAMYVWHCGRGQGLRVIAVGFLLGIVTVIRPDMSGWLTNDRVEVGLAVVIAAAAAYVAVTSGDPRWSRQPWDVVGVIVMAGGAVYLIIEGLHTTRAAPSGQISDLAMMLGTVVARRVRTAPGRRRLRRAGYLRAGIHRAGYRRAGYRQAGYRRTTHGRTPGVVRRGGDSRRGGRAHRRTTLRRRRRDFGFAGRGRSGGAGRATDGLRPFAAGVTAGAAGHRRTRGDRGVLARRPCDRPRRSCTADAPSECDLGVRFGGLSRPDQVGFAADAGDMAH